MLSMAAGAWQGTTAQTEQPRSASQSQSTAAASPVTLRGCLRKGQAAGTFLLVMAASAAEPGLDKASAPAAQTDPDDSAAVPPSEAAVQTIAYELVAGKPALDLSTLIGKRVEAQGTPERTARGASADDSPSAAEAAADSPTASPVGTAGHTSQRSRVRVTVIRPVSGPCE